MALLIKLFYMKNFFKIFMERLAQNWQLVLGISLFGIAGIMVILNSNCVIEHYVLYSAAIIFLLMVNISKIISPFDDPSVFIMLSGIYFVVLAIMWELPISFAWSFIPTAIMAIIVNQENRFMGTILVTIVAIGISLIAREHRLKEEYLETHEPETVVIDYVEKFSKSNIQVYIEDRGIFRFADNISDDWKLNDGDTVQVVIRDRKIIKLIR